MESLKTSLKESPESKANSLSKLFFWWILPLLRVGSRANLSLKDIYHCQPENSSACLGLIFNDEWNQALQTKIKGRSNSPKLWKVIRNIIWQRYFLIGVCFCFDELFLRICQSLLLRRFILTFEVTEATSLEQISYAICLTLITGGRILFYQNLLAATLNIGMQCRLGISSLIFQKILRLGSLENGQLNMGKLVNLLSSEVGRLDKTFNLLHIIYIAPIQLCLYSYLLWQELGVYSLGGILLIFIILPVQIWIGRCFMYFRTRILSRTEDRGRFLNEILKGIYVIKVYAWEKPFSQAIKNLRQAEVEYIKKHMYLKGLYLSLDAIVAKLIPFCALTLFIADGNSLGSDKVAFVIAAFNTLALTVLLKVPYATSNLVETLSTLGRIEDFLLSNDIFSLDARQKLRKTESQRVPRVIMKNLSASLSKNEPAVQNLNIDLKGGQLVMIVGPVASGKTSLLNAILSELPFVSRKSHLVVEGRLTYASQDAWIFPASVRQNILFGLELDKEKYMKILNLTCLSEDIDNLPQKDLTLVGERGTSLSGGQKARVSLARALYQQADIYLLDDPLSAVDIRVGKHLFHECFKLSHQNTTGLKLRAEKTTVQRNPILTMLFAVRNSAIYRTVHELRPPAACKLNTIFDVLDRLAVRYQRLAKAATVGI